VAFPVGESVASKPIADGLTGAVRPVIRSGLLGLKVLLKGLLRLIVLDIPVVAAGFGVVPQCFRPERGERRIVVLFQRVRQPAKAVVREPFVGWPVGLRVLAVTPQSWDDDGFVRVGELGLGE
jgi:hypothetical protein